MALARTLSRATAVSIDPESLGIGAVFCGVGLLVSLLLASGSKSGTFVGPLPFRSNGTKGSAQI
jgi:hypothetical protein